MSLNDIDITTRDNSAPIDLLAAASHIIDTHRPYWREWGWGGDWICISCEARLTEAESRTHTGYMLWVAGYLNMP